MTTKTTNKRKKKASGKTPLATNIVTFPKNKVVRKLPKEFTDRMQIKARERQIEAVIDEVCSYVIETLDDVGVNVYEDKFQRDFGFVAEVLKAMLSRDLAVPHGLHDFLDNYLVPLDADGNVIEIDNKE